VPEIIDTVFAKTSPKRSFSMTEYEHFGLFSRKRGSINSDTEVSLCNVYILIQFQTTFAQWGGGGEGGVKSISRGDSE
jgi:hypothetical protein